MTRAEINAAYLAARRGFRHFIGVEVVDEQIDAMTDWALQAAEEARGPSLTPTIAAELYRAFERLNAPPELLSIIGSYGDSLSDEEALRLLKDYNETGKVLHERQ